MSPKLQPVRGTHDILPEGIAKPDEATFEKFHAVVTRARELATLYGFKEMATPIFEPTEVFSRSMGETSDVVSKEMFTFETKGEDKVTLRPEFTAGTVRAFISNGLQQHLPLKLFSTGPVFRYERPQKGRQRQFHQVNFEWLGDDSWQADVEIITLAGHLLYSLSGPQACTLLINTLGDKESRGRYRDALVKYLTPHAKELSEDSQRRLLINPLRILDSKSPQDKVLIEGAPQITQYLSEESNRRFNYIHEALSEQATLFQHIKITPSLVRGLDYYTDTVFEFVSESDELGAQNTVLAGGRYDGLVTQMGGTPTPAIGFAGGVERLLLLSQNDAKAWPKWWSPIKVFVLPEEDVPHNYGLNVAGVIRTKFYTYQSITPTKRDYTVEGLWHGSRKKRMERADKRGATHVLLIAADTRMVLKNMQTREEQSITEDDLLSLEKTVTLFGLAEKAEK